MTSKDDCTLFTALNVSHNAWHTLHASSGFLTKPYIPSSFATTRENLDMMLTINQ